MREQSYGDAAFARTVYSCGNGVRCLRVSTCSAFLLLLLLLLLLRLLQRRRLLLLLRMLLHLVPLCLIPPWGIDQSRDLLVLSLVPPPGNAAWGGDLCGGGGLAFRRQCDLGPDGYAVADLGALEALPRDLGVRLVLRLEFNDDPHGRDTVTPPRPLPLPPSSTVLLSLPLITTAAT